MLLSTNQILLGTTKDESDWFVCSLDQSDSSVAVANFRQEFAPEAPKGPTFIVQAKIY
jgi:hypothetical protein